MTRSRNLQLALIAAAVLIVYANSLNGGFIFDDQSSITDNPVIRDLGSFLNGGGYAYNSRRFLGYLTFALNFRAAGLSVFGYHLVNVLIHLANALLVFALARCTFRTPLLREASGGDRPWGPAAVVPLLAALLFALHPVESQAVSYIVQRLTSLMTLCYLAALVLYARFRLAQEEGASGAALAAWYLPALAATVCAMYCKENAFTLPVALVVYELAFFRGAPGPRLLRLVPFLATMLIIPLGMLQVGKPVGEVISDVNQATQVQTQMGRWDYLFTQFRVIVTYLRLLVFPVDQNLDYDYPVYHSPFDPPVAASLALLLLLCALAAWLWQRAVKGRPELRVIAFGIVFFFLALAVESSFIPIVDVIFEHRLYLPSVGAFLAAATAVALLLERLAGTRRRLAAGAVALVLVVFGAATVLRNRAWSDGVTLWRDVVAKSPQKVRGYNNLGAALSDGDPEQAIAVLQRALVVKPDHPEAYYNLGRIYLQRPGMLNESIALLLRASELRPGYDDAEINLGAAYLKGGDPATGLRHLQAVSSAAVDRVDRHLNLGVAYVMLGEREKASQEVLFLQSAAPAMAERLQQYLAQRSAGR